MPVAADAALELTAYAWAPSGARGLVRDLRVRWLLEEMEATYRTRLLDLRHMPRADVLPDQPFGQVPAMAEGEVRMFESGAICLHLAERSDALMPRDPVRRARVLSWSIAALNSVEPPIFYLQCVALFDRDRPGAADLQPAAEERVRHRLGQLADALGERPWLVGDFTVADVLMVAVLRQLKARGLLDGVPTLAAYVARGEARPAFQRALADHLADFIAD